MNKKLYFICFAICALMASCRKEEVTVFPDYDKNWLVVEDNPNDATIHANYLFYKETGIPVYVNDTIGSQQRVDVFGKNYTYYQKLSLNYGLGIVQTGANPMVFSFTYAAKADVPAALAFLKSDILSVLPKSVFIPSLFLVENLNSNAFGAFAFKGLNTVMIGKISTIPTLTGTTKAAYKGAILRSILTNSVLADKYNPTLDKFYAISRKYVTTRDAYGLSTFQLNLISGLPTGVTASVQAVGFLGTDPRNSFQAPVSTFMDVCMYIEAIMGNTDAQFRQLYGTNPNIMAKYVLIRQILTDIGVTLS